MTLNMLSEQEQKSDRFDVLYVILPCIKWQDCIPTL